MESLLVNVGSFLVVPESVLSVIFLCIFVICFIYGIVKVADCKKYLENFRQTGIDDYQKEKNRLNQKQFVSKYVSELAAKEVRINDLSNLFVSIGILGTFIGLGVAIHGASDLLSSDKVDVIKLNAILGIIAFKFQTSVWGTFFSIIFQVFVVEPYYIYKHGVLGEVEKAIYADAVSLSTALEWQLAELQGMHAGQNEVKNAIVEGVDQQIKTRETLVQDNNSKQQRFENFAERMVGKQSEINERMAKEQKALWGDALEKSQHNADNLAMQLRSRFDESNGMTKDNFEAMSKRLNDSVDMLVASQQETFSQVNKENSDNFEAMSKRLNDSVDMLVTSQQEAFSQVNKENSDNFKLLTDDLKGKLKDLSDCQKTIMDEVNDVSRGNARTVMANVSDQLSQQRDYMSDLVKKQNEISEQLAVQQKVLLGDTKMAAIDNAKIVVDNVTAQLSNQRDFMAEMLGKQNEMSEQLAMQQKALIGDTRDDTKNKLELVITNVAEQLKKQRAFIEKLIAQQSQLNEILLGDMQKSHETNANYMREGVIQQMEQYRRYAEELSEEQKAVQGILDQKLSVLTDSIDRTSESMRNYEKSAENTLCEQRTSQASLEVKINQLMENIDKTNDILDVYKEHTSAVTNGIETVDKVVDSRVKQLYSDIGEMVENSIFGLRQEVEMLKKSAENNGQVLTQIAGKIV